MILWTGGVIGSTVVTYADGQLLRDGVNIDPEDINPDRELTLAPRTLYFDAGLGMSLTDGSYIEPLVLPFGAAYGIIDNLEAGLDFALALNNGPPTNNAFSFQEPRVYGRYALLPKMLALDASFFIPVGKELDAFALRVETPFRYAVTPDFLVMAAMSFNAFFGEDFSDIEQLGGTAIYRIVPKLWAAIEVGFNMQNFKFGHAAVPLGFSAGFEVLSGIAVLPGFRFADIGHPESRVFQVLAVYTWQFAAAASGGEETPDIPR